MPYVKKVHYWTGCAHNTDRATRVEEVTCGRCKQRILEALLVADWSNLPPGWPHALRTAALVAYGIHDQLCSIESR